jgi:bifunctional non-homologous end joining protein LigD
MLPRLTDRLPMGDGWLYEPKFDGHRALGVRTRQTVSLLSRNELPLDLHFPEIPEALRKLPCRSCVVDGEVVAGDESGSGSTRRPQHIGPHQPALLYYLFDLLHLDGRDLTVEPLIERRKLLQRLLNGQPAILAFSARLNGRPEELVAEIERRGLQGIIAKKVDSLYESGRRSGSWLKWTSLPRAEFVRPFTDPRDGRPPFIAQPLPGLMRTKRERLSHAQ